MNLIDRDEVLRIIVPNQSFERMRTRIEKLPVHRPKRITLTKIVPQNWPKPGEHIQFCGQEWVALGIEQGGWLVIKAEPLSDEMPFDENGVADWRKSSVRQYLNGEYLKSLCCTDDALIEFESDLTADDGQKDYGTCKDKVFLLSDSLYRKYREYTPKYDKLWWTITPFSPSYDYNERCVYKSGPLYFNNAINTYGLVPSLCLNLSSLSKIFDFNKRIKIK